MHRSKKKNEWHRSRSLSRLRTSNYAEENKPINRDSINKTKSSPRVMNDTIEKKGERGDLSLFSRRSILPLHPIFVRGASNPLTIIIIIIMFLISLSLSLFVRLCTFINHHRNDQRCPSYISNIFGIVPESSVLPRKKDSTKGFFFSLSPFSLIEP